MHGTVSLYGQWGEEPMQGCCSLCGQWSETLQHCRICGDPTGSCCYSFSRRCCQACRAEFDEDPE